MSNETETTSSKRAKAEVETVHMHDHRKVDFAGNRKMLKEQIIGEDGTVKVRFDFRNGHTRTFEVPDSMLLQAAAHGISQKIGDETAGEKDVDDMVVAVDAIIERLQKGEWNAARAAGDGFSGASVVIKAICEVTGKSVDEVKAFLQGKLDEAKEKGTGLTRQALYASFRRPGSKTAEVIARLEAEKNSKSSVNADELLGELA